jgi:NADH-quinone oxidoreductase subunit M
VCNEHVAHLSDITLREKVIFSILAMCVLAMGLYPMPFSEMMHASVNDLLVHLGDPNKLLVPLSELAK